MRVDGDAPVDLSGHTPIRVPFVGRAGTTLGSLAVDPATRALFMGEENGRRIWRLDGASTVLYATGLRRLAGGSTLAFDRTGRLLVIDYVDPLVSPPEERLPPGLDHLREDDYRGPLVLRLALDAADPLPRRLDNTPPLYPRAWGGRGGGRTLPHLISLTPLASSDVMVLGSTGQLYRLGGDGALTPFARLPRAQYHRTNMVAAADGAVYVSGGFHVGQILRVSPDGVVTVVASGLADPAGIAVNAQGAVYVAESSRHRILRLR